MPNPFYFGGRVQPEQFVGRQAELGRIFSALETAHTGQMQSVSVVGTHRMGRSSLLYYITCRYGKHLQQPESYRIAYISLHDAECHIPGGVLNKILKELRVPVKGGGQPTPVAFQQALEDLQRQSLKAVVCLDEFEELIHTGVFTNEFFDSWRHLMSNNLVAFVVASTRPLPDLVNPNKFTSSFFNIFTILPLGELAVVEAEQLVRRGRSCDRPFNDEDCQQMRALAGRHPYKLQAAGQAIYLAKGEPPVNWKKLKASLSRQYQQADLEWRQPDPRALGQIGLYVLCSIGRAVLEVRRSKSEISDSTALWWGVITILIPLLILSGLAPLGWLFKLVKLWLGQ